MKLHFKTASACLLAGMMFCASGTTVFATTDNTTAASTVKTGKQVIDRLYYINGVFQSNYTGWKKIKGKIYYFKKGKAVTGWKYLKSYSGGKKKYKYRFKPNGVLVTNLFNYQGKYNKMIQKPMTIEVNLTTHNATFLLYDNKTKKYCIPAKTVICSTSRYKDGTRIRSGQKGRLEKTSARRWFIYKKANPWRYYQYGVHIKNSDSWFHSTLYTTNDPTKLISPNHYNGYNYLGTDQTTSCIRMQAVNAKLIYDIATKTNPKARVWVKIYRSSNKGPFGKITLKDTTGKLNGNVNIDPTDPKYTNKKY